MLFSVETVKIWVIMLELWFDIFFVGVKGPVIKVDILHQNGIMIQLFRWFVELSILLYKIAFVASALAY